MADVAGRPLLAEGQAQALGGLVLGIHRAEYFIDLTGGQASQPSVD
jgi:hypothetical protein